MQNSVHDKNYRKLPTKLYLVRVPIIATYSQAELDLYGIPTDFVDGKEEKESYKEFTNAMIPIARMIEMYEFGYPIKIINKKDSVAIYNALEKYLKDWSVDFRYSPNMKVDTIDKDRLELIDKFLNEVFDFNKGSIVKDIAGQQSGYQMNTPVMGVHMANTQNEVPRSNEQPRGQAVGMMSGYGPGTEDIAQEQPTLKPPTYNRYRQPNIPKVDLNEVKRKKLVERDASFNYNDLNNLK
jgi:hypothetical protein